MIVSVTRPDDLKAALRRTDRHAHWAARVAIGAILASLGVSALGVEQHWLTLMGWAVAGAVVAWVTNRSKADGIRLVLHSACPSLHAGCCAPYDMERCSVGRNRDYARRRRNADRRGILLPPADHQRTAGGGSND